MTLQHVDCSKPNLEFLRANFNENARIPNLKKMSFVQYARTGVAFNTLRESSDSYKNAFEPMLFSKNYCPILITPGRLQAFSISTSSGAIFALSIGAYKVLEYAFKTLGLTCSYGGIALGYSASTLGKVLKFTAHMFGTLALKTGNQTTSFFSTYPFKSVKVIGITLALSALLGTIVASLVKNSNEPPEDSFVSLGLRATAVSVALCVTILTILWGGFNTIPQATSRFPLKSKMGLGLVAGLGLSIPLLKKLMVPTTDFSAMLASSASTMIITAIALTGLWTTREIPWHRLSVIRNLGKSLSHKIVSSISNPFLQFPLKTKEGVALSLISSACAIPLIYQSISKTSDRSREREYKFIASIALGVLAGSALVTGIWGLPILNTFIGKNRATVLKINALASLVSGLLLYRNHFEPDDTNQTSARSVLTSLAYDQLLQTIAAKIPKNIHLESSIKSTRTNVDAQFSYLHDQYPHPSYGNPIAQIFHNDAIMRDNQDYVLRLKIQQRDRENYFYLLSDRKMMIPDRLKIGAEVERSDLYQADNFLTLANQFNSEDEAREFQLLSS